MQKTSRHEWYNNGEGKVEGPDSDSIDAAETSEYKSPSYKYLRIIWYPAFLLY